MTNPICNNQYMLGKDFTPCEVNENRVVRLKYRPMGFKIEVIYVYIDGTERFEFMTREEFNDKIGFIP